MVDLKKYRHAVTYKFEFIIGVEGVTADHYALAMISL